jgi:hypothetical protein
MRAWYCHSYRQGHYAYGDTLLLIRLLIVLAQRLGSRGFTHKVLTRLGN